MLELRPRLELPDAEIIGRGTVPEVRSALEGLGYRDDEIRAVLLQLPGDLGVEEMLKRSLQELGREGL